MYSTRALFSPVFF